MFSLARVINFVQSKTFKNILVTYISSIVSAGCGFLTMTIIIRKAGVDVYGKLVVLNSVAGMILNVVSIRTGEATVRFVRAEYEKKNLERMKFFLFIGFVVDLIVAFAFLGILTLLSRKLAYWFLKDVVYYKDIIFYGFITFFTILRGTVLGYLTSFERFGIIAFFNVLENGVKLSLIIILVFILRDVLTLQKILWLYVSSALLITLLLYFYFSFNYKNSKIKQVNLSFSKFYLKEYISFVSRTFLSILLKAGNQNMDNLLFSYFINTKIVGLYDIIKKLFIPYTIGIASVTRVFYPKMVALYAKRKDLRKFIIKWGMLLCSALIIYGSLVYLLKGIVFSVLRIEYTRYFDVLYLLVVVLTTTQSLFWWTRSFSNTVNPNFSLVANLILTFLYFVIWFLFGFSIIKFSFKIISVFIVVSKLIIDFYWIFVFRKFNLTYLNIKGRKNVDCVIK